MKYRDRYPRKCIELCPVCKRQCSMQEEKHTDADGNWTAHVCGPHWWVKFKTNGHVMEIYGNAMPTKP